MPESLTFQVNGNSYTQSCLPGTSLLSLLRNLGWVGVHRVCETGDCGSCTVWVDDVPIHSCIYPAMQIEGHSVTTIEGLASDGEMAPMQQAFLDCQGFQCGFCTPGMIMSAEKIVETLPANVETRNFASLQEMETEIRSALEGNLCRCTGYQAIVDSILMRTGKGNCRTPERLQLTTTDSGPVGQSIPKLDGPTLVTGKPAYTADWTPEGLLHLKVLRRRGAAFRQTSPHPHARIRSIHTEKARAMPGVQAVFTHEDVPRIPYSTAGHGDSAPDTIDHYLLDNKVRFIGDRVAAVVAESPGIAEQACQLIEVDYEILPYVIDPVAAMNDCGVVIHFGARVGPNL